MKILAKDLFVGVIPEGPKDQEQVSYWERNCVITIEANGHVTIGSPEKPYYVQFYLTTEQIQDIKEKL